MAISEKDSVRIARVVRDLRKKRAWTQADLAQKLGLSRTRLSEIEGGDGSFTAEQFLEILRLFNVTTARFVGQAIDDSELQLRNALARFGAHHLQEDRTTTPNEVFDNLATVIKQALVQRDPRLVTALAPVLMENIDAINLVKLQLDLNASGLAWRLAWVCENTAQAIEDELRRQAPRSWAQRARHAAVTLNAFVEAANLGLENDRSSRLAAFSVDPAIKSAKTLEAVKARMSEISRRWKQVTDLQPDDFAQALRAARDAHT
jgi:transcriptional regulator with XRE-family HTH domain/post-segregation antitoxin (ccd killing protein)